MAKYRKKPVIIEATQFFRNVLPWPSGVEVEEGEFEVGYGKCMNVGVQTLEGFMSASDGDWIITGVKGEKYPCKPDIFAATYEAAERSENPSAKVSWRMGEMHTWVSETEKSSLWIDKFGENHYAWCTQKNDGDDRVTMTGRAESEKKAKEAAIRAIGAIRKYVSVDLQDYR